MIITLSHNALFALSISSTITILSILYVALFNMDLYYAHRKKFEILGAVQAIAALFLLIIIHSEIKISHHVKVSDYSFMFANCMLETFNLGIISILFIKYYHNTKTKSPRNFTSKFFYSRLLISLVIIIAFLYSLLHIDLNIIHLSHTEHSQNIQTSLNIILAFMLFNIIAFIPNLRMLKSSDFHPDDKDYFVYLLAFKTFMEFLYLSIMTPQGLFKILPSILTEPYPVLFISIAIIIPLISLLIFLFIKQYSTHKDNINSAIMLLFMIAIASILPYKYQYYFLLAICICELINIILSIRGFDSYYHTNKKTICWRSICKFFIGYLLPSSIIIIIILYMILYSNMNFNTPLDPENLQYIPQYIQILFHIITLSMFFNILTSWPEMDVWINELHEDSLQFIFWQFIMMFRIVFLYMIYRIFYPPNIFGTYYMTLFIPILVIIGFADDRRNIMPFVRIMIACTIPIYILTNY